MITLDYAVLQYPISIGAAPYTPTEKYPENIYEQPYLLPNTIFLLFTLQVSYIDILITAHSHMNINTLTLKRI